MKTELDGSEDLGLVQSIYRGANTKDGVTRRQRVTKPAAHPLPLSRVSRIRLVRLTQMGVSENRGTLKHH